MWEDTCEENMGTAARTDKGERPRETMSTKNKQKGWCSGEKLGAGIERQRVSLIAEMLVKRSHMWGAGH